MIAHTAKTIPHRIYVDADAFVALTLNTDSNHTKAQEIEEQIFIQKPRLYTSQFVLGEAITVISQKSTIATAISFGKYILASSFTIQMAGHHHMEQALKRFAKQTSKNSRFTDVINMVFMDEAKIDTIFSFDRHYEQNGYHLLSY